MVGGQAGGTGRASAKPAPGTDAALVHMVETWAGKPLETQEEAHAALLDMTDYFSNNPIPPVVADYIMGRGTVAKLQAQADALLNAPPAVPEHTVAAHAAAWHRHQQALVSAGQMSADRCANNQTCLAHFTGFLGAVSDVNTINTDKLDGFYRYCAGRVAARRTDPEAGWSLAYAKDVFSVAKTYIRWLWERAVLELPKNIGSKSFRFGSSAKAVRTWTVDEYRLAVREAPGKLRLCLLLMANTGMTQADVSDLLDTEVDWAAGRITRRRSKTAEHEAVPTVCYPLWPLTFDLLKKYRSGGERVLLTESGLPYVRKELVGGKLVKADGFASCWVHVKKRLKLDRSLKQLRKLGATLLESHPVYGRLVSHWLGHSPRSVAARHYTRPLSGVVRPGCYLAGTATRLLSRSAGPSAAPERPPVP